jgi:hypothetical protein
MAASGRAGHRPAEAVTNMTEASGENADSTAALADRASYLVGVAARAPSLHNTQPWRFKVGEHVVELYADAARQLQEDPAGREMVIGCGAALFGLRLAVRSLGYLPEVEVFPEPAEPGLLARVRVGRAEPMTPEEHRMLLAVPHRHTHRGLFEPCPLPAGLFACLQREPVGVRQPADPAAAKPVHTGAYPDTPGSARAAADAAAARRGPGDAARRPTGDVTEPEAQAAGPARRDLGQCSFGINALSFPATGGHVSGRGDGALVAGFRALRPYSRWAAGRMLRDRPV